MKRKTKLASPPQKAQTRVSSVMVMKN